MDQQLTCFSSFNQVTFGFCFSQASCLNLCSWHSCILLSLEALRWCVTDPSADSIISLRPTRADWDILVPGPHPLLLWRAAIHMQFPFRTSKHSQSQRVLLQPAQGSTPHFMIHALRLKSWRGLQCPLLQMEKWNRKGKGEYDNRFWRIQPDHLQQN